MKPASSALGLDTGGSQSQLARDTILEGPYWPEPVRVLSAEPRYRRVIIRTPVRWEHWQDFYNEVIDPLIREGAEITIHVEVAAGSETGVRENTIELGIKESLFQRGVWPEIEAR